MLTIFKIVYWISTLAMCGIMLFSASMYLTKTDMIQGYFESMQYPSYLVIPLAVAKVLGVLAIIFHRVKILKEWAYAGFFFDAVLATTAHAKANDGGYGMALALLFCLLISRFTGHWARHHQGVKNA